MRHQQGEVRCFIGAGASQVSTTYTADGVKLTAPGQILPTILSCEVGAFPVDNLFTGLSLAIPFYPDLPVYPRDLGKIRQELDDGDWSAALEIAGVTKYYFTNQSSVVPYVGLKGGWLHTTSSGAEDYAVGGVMVGLEMMHRNGRSSTYVELGYQGTLESRGWQQSEIRLLLGIGLSRLK